MSNLPFDEKLAFDTELTVETPFTGVAELLGQLTNVPVVLFVKNQTTASVFFADNSGSTKGTTMAPGEEFVLDCRSNNGTARNMGFQIGTALFVTGLYGDDGGTANFFKVSVLYAY